jgi:NAD(P)-dependent dehydrogenase (short-subunit alcohol dehydrogenase family)
MRREGARAEAFEMDVTDRASVDAAVERAEAALGPLDVLVNNAGVAITRRSSTCPSASGATCSTSTSTARSASRRRSRSA